MTFDKLGATQEMHEPLPTVGGGGPIRYGRMRALIIHLLITRLVLFCLPLSIPLITLSLLSFVPSFLPLPLTSSFPIIHMIPYPPRISPLFNPLRPLHTTSISLYSMLHTYKPFNSTSILDWSSTPLILFLPSLLSFHSSL